MAAAGAPTEETATRRGRAAVPFRPNRRRNFRVAAATLALSIASVSTREASALSATSPSFRSPLSPRPASSSRRARSGWGLHRLGSAPAGSSDSASVGEATTSSKIEREDQEDDEADQKVDEEPCNVVFTHTNADFDSLAAAVALALLWRHERPEIPTHVVLPRGVHPAVQRFLAFHKHLLPLRGFKTILAEDVRAIGVVDAQQPSRIGRGQSWLETASSIHVFDHHEPDDDKEEGRGRPASNGDADADKDGKSHAKKRSLADMATEVVIERVGSTTTLLVERLKAAKISPSPHEATLFVLGIRADTGGLVYEGTTIRDAAALLWCLEEGASQVAISEFGTSRVSEEQRAVMNAALRRTRTDAVHGLRVSSVQVSLSERYVAGLAQVCEELLDLTDSDVFLLGATHRSGAAGNGGKKKKKKQQKNSKGDEEGVVGLPTSQWISLIGRASPRAAGVDLNSVMRSFGGGGHPKAAAAALRCDNGQLPEEGEGEEALTESERSAYSNATAPRTLEERVSLAVAGRLSADDVLATATDIVERQIPEQLVASSFMVPRERLVSLTADQTVDEARIVFDSHGLKSAPVIDADTGRFRGSLKLNDLVKANRSGRKDDRLKGMIRSSVETVLPDTPMADVEVLLVNKGVGRLPVVDDDGILVGIVTRTDVLRQHHLYDDLDDHHR